MSSPTENLYVMKRDGRHQPISFDKILQRIGALTQGLEVDAAYVAQQVVSQIFPGVKTTVLDEFSAQICAHLQTDHPDYGALAVRLVISNNHKETSPRFSEAMRKAYTNYEKDGRHNPLISERLWNVIRENADEIDGWVRHEADYEYDYFGFQTLLKSYLLRQDGQVIERPQYMLLRVSLGLWYENLEGARRSYTKLSQLYFTHATPTLFHAGSQRPQLSSCFLLGTHDSIDGIYKTITDCAKISKWAGGIGIHASEIRGKGAKIKGTQGTTDGIIPMLRVYNETARYVNQCFAAGTMVVTRHGLAPIESITEGTMVLTGANTWEPVLGLMERATDKESKESDIVYELRTHLSKESVIVTGEHEIWALRCQGSRGNLYAMRSLVKKKRIQPKMVKVSELNLDDYVGFPVEKPGDVIDEAKINERDVYDGFVWWRAETVPEREDWSQVNLRVPETVEWLVKSIKEVTGQGEDAIETERLDAEWVKVRWRKSEGENGFVIDLNGEEYRRYGWLRGMMKVNGSQVLMTTDAKKMELARELIYRCGFGCLVEKQRGTYVLTIPRSRRSGDVRGEKFHKTGNRYYFYHAGHHWTPLRKLRTIGKNEAQYPERVYDLNVKDEHTYVVRELGTVHNSGRRNGSIAIYLEPHHPDILEFMELRKNHGAEEERCRDLFTALWVSDCFMERVEYAQKHPDEEVWWPLIHSSDQPDLQNLVGEAYKARIEETLREGTYVKKIPVLTIWKKMLASQIETGTPYVTNKDAVNLRSNQQNIGVIRSSNLCNEIVEYSDEKEYACCCLASINLSRFYCEGKEGDERIDWDSLVDVCGVVVENLNRVIDLNFYPVPETERSNNKHRPIGVGIQGLADLFAMLGIAWDDPDAVRLNALLMEAISYGCWRKSCEIARRRMERMREGDWVEWAWEQGYYNKIAPNKQGGEDGTLDPDLLYWYDGRTGERWTQREIQQYIEAPDARKRGASWWGGYTTFEGSPLSRGLFQHDMWGVSPSGRWDWDGLREDVKVWGVRNSLCTALMPTASTAQIMGNNECFEPFSNLLYVRRTLAGDFVILNKYLVRELLKRGLWNRDLKEWMVASNGSVQKIPEIPQDLRRIYKTVYEVKQKVVIECAAARAPFVDQTQSMNLFFIDPAPNVVSAALLFGWKQGLKTMLYYLRSQPSVQAQQVTVDPKKLKALQEGGARNQEETKGEEGARSRFQQRMAERGLASSSTANTPDCEFCSA